MDDKENKYKKGITSAVTEFLGEMLMAGAPDSLLPVVQGDSELKAKLANIHLLEEISIDIVKGRGDVEELFLHKKRIVRDIILSHVGEKAATTMVERQLKKEVLSGAPGNVERN